MFHNYKMHVLQGRVNAGVRWLDGYFGREGWLGTINTQRLDLASPNTCMIGQMFGQLNQHMRDNFNSIIARKILTTSQAAARGFYLYPMTAPWRPSNEMYTELTTMWVEKIGELKHAPKAVVSPIQRDQITSDKQQ